MIEVYKTNDGWRWRVKAKNGEIVASGEAYSTRMKALEGAITAGELLSAEDVSVRFLAPPAPVISRGPEL